MRSQLETMRSCSPDSSSGSASHCNNQQLPIRNGRTAFSYLSCKSYQLGLLVVCFLCLCYRTAGVGTASTNDLNCPVCIRMIKAAREFGKGQDPPTSVSKALEKYCTLGTALSVEEQQFCYNIDNVRGEINRMLDLGADELRVCKKVKSMNPHFCVSKSSKKVSSTKETSKSNSEHRTSRNKRGIIYI